MFRPCGLLVSLTYGINSLATLRDSPLFVLMHNGIVNAYQLLCEAHTVLELHRAGELAPYALFLLCVCPIYFLGASIVCVNNRGQQSVLLFPDRTSVCTHPYSVESVVKSY